MPVDTTTHPTHNLSGMAGSFTATYEFVVNVPQTDQFSPVLLGDNVWWLKFDQESAPSTQVNQLGVTKRNVGDYFFASISGQSLASPYGRDAHIVYTYDGSNTEAFVDGQKVGSLSGHGRIFTHAASQLGWSSVLPDRLHNLKGRILAFASYRSVLPDEEIQSHYNAAFPGRVSDHLWLWCHVKGAHNDEFNPPRSGWGLGKNASSIEPETAANQMGIQRIFFIAYPDHPQNLLVPSPTNYRSYYETHRFNQFNKTIWSMTGGSGITGNDVVNEAIKLATAKTNITGFVMDDFFIGGTRLTISQLDSIRARIPRELGWSSPNLWVVLYDDELNRSSYDSYLKRFDYITLWTKDSDNLSKLPENLATLEIQVSRFANPPKIALGCYMWDYQNLTNPRRQPRKMPLNKVRFQLAKALEWLKNGRISDVIIPGSNIVDVGRASAAVAETKKWIRDHGSEVLP